MNLSLEDYNLVKGEIYKITNRLNNMCYIGQTRTHRLNKNKYRVFGYKGRFKDHLSEAINNTKTNQCRYLNNAIRLHKEHFYCELIETCSIDELDEREKYYISSCNTMHPNGYNLTPGGKYRSSIKLEKNELSKPGKRGRPSGYSHTPETIAKIKDSINLVKEHMKEVAARPEEKVRRSTVTRCFYDKFKVDMLSKVNLSEDPSKYIKEIKKDGIVCNYKIYINRQLTFRVKSKFDSLEEKYNRLLTILREAKLLYGKNESNLPKGELVTSSEGAFF